jgi:hypothetical protein
MGRQVVRITLESGPPRGKLCGIGNILKSSLNGKVKLLKAEILCLTAYDDDDDDDNAL